MVSPLRLNEVDPRQLGTWTVTLSSRKALAR